MSIELNRLFHFNKSNIKLAADVCAKAYYDDLLFTSFFPNITKRKLMNDLFKFGLYHALNYGELYATSQNIEGIAAWFPYNKLFISTWQMIKYGILPIIVKVGRESLKKMLLYEKFCKEKHVQFANFPHWYLHNIAVDPIYQGKGYASKLLKPMLAKLDDQNLPCCLETQKKSNVSIYQHFGFEIIEKTIIPELEVDSWFMLRKNIRDKKN
jgi:hypothetical protein